MAAKKKVTKKKTQRKATRRPRKTSKKAEDEFRSVKGEVVEPESAARADTDEDTPANGAADEGDDFPVDVSAAAAETKAIAAADPMARYMAEIRKYPLLTKEQEHEIAVRYRETMDPQAAEQLVTANLRFVVKIAAEYTRFGARLIDLVQEGNVGLMHAVREFNPYKGVRLITYAVWWIRGYIREYLMRQYSLVRIGTTASQKKLFYQLQREKEQLEKMGYQQAIAQLSGRLGVSESEIQDMQKRLSGRDVSLDQPVGEDGSTRLMDLQSTPDPVQLDDQLEQKEELALLNEKIDRLRPSLNDREVFLLEARLLSDEPLTLQEIGDKYGVTREAVRQMEARLLEKLRQV